MQAHDTLERQLNSALASGRSGAAFDPERDVEERFLDEIADQPDVPS